MPGRTAVASAPETKEHEELIQEVASSSAFAKAPALRKLLLYLWEHRASAPGEYAIALDVLGKRDDFDPKIDASVRVHLSRLRQKLKEFSENEGAHQPLRVVVPPGTHQLVCEPRPEIVIESPVLALAKRWAMPAAVVLLALFCGILWFQYRATREELAKARRNLQLPAIWQSILKPGHVTRITYPIPVFYFWGELRVRDVKNNVREGWRGSPSLKPLVEMFGPPGLSRSYTVSSDTVATIQLTRFLSSHGIPLEVTSTESLQPDQYGKDNLIFLGIPPTNRSLDPYLSKINFFMKPGNGAVGNRVPLPGEPVEFAPRTLPGQPPDPSKYNVFAVLPGYAPGTNLVLLIGLHTSALASFVTTPFSLDELEARWKQEGSPEHFEMVIHTETDGFQTKMAKPVAFRVIH